MKQVFTYLTERYPAMGQWLARTRRGLALLACLFALGLSTLAWLAAPATADTSTTAEYPSPDALTPQPLPVIELSGRLAPLDLSSLAGYWTDESARATVEQVEQLARQALPINPLFKPYLDHTKHIVDKRVLWLRFEALNKDPKAHWFLEVGMPTVDQLSLFWRNDQGQWTQQNAGDQVLRSEWPLASRMPVFALNHHATMPTQYYLRVQHERVPFAAPLRLHSDYSLLAQREQEHLWLGAYFGLIVLGLGFGLFNTWHRRDHSFTQYALYVGMLGLTHAVCTGLGAQHLWPGALDWSRVADGVMPPLALAAGVWLMRTVLSPQRLWPLAYQALMLLMGILLATALVDALWPSNWGFILLNSAALVTLLALAVVLWLALQQTDLNLRWLALGFAPAMLAVVFPVLRNLGVLSTGFLTQYAPLLGAAISAPVLLVTLTTRAINLRVARVRAMALMQSDPLTGLPNDRLMMQNLHGTLMRAERYRHQFALLLVELTNLDWFNLEHGRLVGDRALLLLATRLGGVARNVDTAARLQDNLFVLLMEGPTSAAQAVQAATQILSRSLRPSEQLPVGASLKVHITAALFPDAQALDFGEDANACLNWLVAQSASAIEVPRKAIHTVNF